MSHELHVATVEEADLQVQPLRFLQAYWSVWQTFTHALDDALTRHTTLDVRGFLALSFILDGKTSPGVLARTLNIPKYETTRVLDRLTHIGAITRHPDPRNGRYQHLHLTPHGLSLWRDAIRLVQDVTMPPLERLGPDLETLTTTLERLARHATHPTPERT